MCQLMVNDLSYSIGDKKILNNISFTCNAGEVIAIVGKNGVGKTTLLNNILENLNKSNTIELKNAEERLGYVPQFRQIDEELPLSVEDFVALPLVQKKIPWLSKKEKKNIDDCLTLTQSSHQKNKSLGRLSGGERQRVYLSQALVNKPNLLLLDEFTSNLDKNSELQCMQLIRDITKKENIITLCITHELSLIDENYVDKILYLAEDGYKFIDIKDYYKEQPNLDVCSHCVGGCHA